MKGSMWGWHLNFCGFEAEPRAEQSTSQRFSELQTRLCPDPSQGGRNPNPPVRHGSWWQEAHLPTPLSPSSPHTLSPTPALSFPGPWSPRGPRNLTLT